MNGKKQLLEEENERTLPTDKELLATYEKMRQALEDDEFPAKYKKQLIESIIHNIIYYPDKKIGSFLFAAKFYDEKHGIKQSTSNEIRTHVLTLKGLRPGPLDDGGLFIDRSIF